MTTRLVPRLASFVRGLAASERVPFARLTRQDRTLLLLCALCAVALDFFRYPALFGEAGVFDDNAYWVLADKHSPFIRFLFLPDGHYLSVISRAIVGVPVALGFQPDHLGLFFQIATSGARGLLLGVVVLSPFRALLGPAGCRLALFAFLILFGDYQLRLVYNLGYSQIVFTFFVLLLSLFAAGRNVVALLLVACVAALTKITVLVLLPIAAVAMVFNRGGTRWVLALLAAGMIANLIVVIATGGFEPSDYTGWLVDTSVGVAERLQTALYLAPMTIAFLAGLPVDQLGLAACAAIGAVALAAACVIVGRRAGAIVGLCVFATALGYALGSAWSLTRIVNLKALESLGMVRYHLFPLYAIAGLALVILAAAAAQAIFRRIPAQRYAAGLAAAVVFVALFAGGVVQRGMPKRDSWYHMLTGAGYWRSMARLLDFDANANFCVAVPNTFPYLVGPKGGCPLVFTEATQSRLIAAPVDSPEKEIAIEVAAVAGPPRKILAFGFFLRAAGFVDESMRFTVTLYRQGRREEFEAIRAVKASGSFAYFHLPEALPDISRITIKPHGSFLVIMDEQTRKPWVHMWGSSQ